MQAIKAERRTVGFWRVTTGIPSLMDLNEE